MGDDEDMLSSNLTKTSDEDVNEQSMNNDNPVVEELSNVGENLPKSDVIADSPLEPKPNEDAVIEGNSENQDVGNTAVEAEIDTKEIMDEVVGGGDELLPKAEDSRGGLAEEADSLASEKEEMPKEDIEDKCDDEAGNEPMVEEEKPALGADLEMPTSGGDRMPTTVVVDDNKLDGPDCATSIKGTPIVAGSVDLTSGSAENELSNTHIASSEPAFVAPEVAEMKASVDSGVGSVTVVEETSVTESKDLQITAENSLDDSQQSLKMVSLESSSPLTGAEDAPDAAAADLETSVTVTDATVAGGPVDAVEKDTVITDAKAATDSQTDADTDVELAEVIKEEQGIGTDNFPAVSSEALAMSNEAEQDRGDAQKESVIADSEMVEATGVELSKDFEMRDMELGGDKQVMATGPEESEIKMEEGVILVDAKDEMEESKVEIDQGENEDSDPDEDEESLHKLDDSENAEDDEDAVTGEETGLVDTEQETETDVGESVKATDAEMETETYEGESGRAVGGKRKRGKNSKATANSKLASRSRKTTDEDVCFICFDGGDLFICDRRGCGKAYHPSCVNRDEAFFRAKGRWNCGWHLCSKCEKNAHYMCYTCTFSLCKACIKDAVILCVRGNKGFCETCMRTVMLIENFDQSQRDAQIDLDDTTSWEFLFKDYYTDLKSKLSLSFAEISEAKNPWKGSDAVTIKEDISEVAVGANSNEGSGSDNHGEKQEARKSKRKKDKKRLKTLAKGRLSSAAASTDDGEGISLPGNTEWASKELLEFVMHMKDGDNSPVSQFDVQALLLEYIKRNKLRDPRRKSQILCDSRFQNLFGKPQVGHFEMLKLLESHFLVREDSQADDIEGSVVDTEANQLEDNENAETPTKGTKDRKRKLRKKGIGGGPQYSRYEFAAIDMHNISLIYLRRKLMEDLLEDTDEFSNKVVGTFVRIRISGNMQKQDLYRLVLVVGTSKAADPYKVGKRTTDTMLEILNLNKTEIVSIDSISNQDFTEEECKRLRQSIKCGLLNRMTVGDILDKAMELQEARVKDWLETEILRLSHLRDRASDLGRKKELRECVEKLQILKTPEERLRRLEEVPQIHADPNMDPNHESEDDSEQEDSRQVFTKSRSSSFSRRGNVQVSSGSDFSSKDSWNGGKFSSKNQDVHASFLTKNSTMGEDAFQSFDMVKDNSRNQRRDQEAPDVHYQKLSSPAKPETAGWSSLPVARSDKVVGVGSVDSLVSVSAKHGVTEVSAVNPPTSLPTNEVAAVKVNETQKMWHYQDPSGKVQGPFSMVQLRKWSNTGYFPADLKIWKATDKQDNSILLTDALAGRFPQELPSGASAISTSRSLLSDLSGKTSDISFQVAREQNHSAALHDLKLSAEKLISNDLSNLPSPTPNRGNVGRSREEEIAAGANSYSVNVQSPVTALGRHASLSSAPTLIQNSAEHMMRGPESDSRNSDAGFASEQSARGSVHPSQDSLFSAPGHLDAMEKHSDIPLPSATTNPGIQPVNSQNTQAGTHSWGAPPSQNLEINVSGPVQGTPQAYNHQGAITSTVQTPVASFSNSGLVLPQSAEYWRPPTQGDQPNMQPVSNPAWGSGPVDPNTAALALGPGNSNMGWTPMQGVPNAGWVGPVPGAPNMNYGAVVQGPAGNANPGWIMANMNLAAPVQGPNMGNMNPCWFVPPGNPGVQGLGPGLVTAGWVPPANTVPAVQAPIPGNGWAMPNVSPAAPLQGSAPGNTTQGWNAQAGNQGTPGSAYQDGGKYSGQRDRGPQSRDSTFGGGRGWNRQSSFGRGGGGGSSRSRRDAMMCPYNGRGRCRKGAACDYRHA